MSTAHVERMLGVLEMGIEGYTSMTYGELRELEDCSQCIFHGEICKDGMSSHGGVFIEPPCCNLKDSDDMYEAYKRFVGYREQALMEHIEEQERKEAKRVRNELALRRRRETKFAVREETAAIKSRQAMISSLQHMEGLRHTMLVVNSMMSHRTYEATPDEIALEVKGKIQVLQDEIRQLNLRKQAKIKELAKSRKAQESR